MINPLLFKEVSTFCIFFLFHFTCVRNTARDDEEWTALYGNDPHKSGVWEYLGTIKNDEEKMRNISIQAHVQCFDLTPNITWANSSVKELRFPDHDNFHPIQIDVLMYTVEGRYLYDAPNVSYYFYLTKGMKPNCVYYLIPPEPLNFKVLNLLSDHICDIVMP